MMTIARRRCFAARQGTLVACLVSLGLAATHSRSDLVARDWPSWRGPEQNGVSRETKLPDTFDVLWKKPIGGRSTPVVLNGRVYIVNGSGSGVNEQERVVCFDAETGNVIFEYKFNVFLTDIPSDRVGWASPAADPETGYVYAHGVQNTFTCLDRDGKIVWRRSLHEDFGVIAGYGGRTHTPVVDGDLVIISFLNSSWGPHAVGRQRYVAFDKRTGEVRWWSTPGGPPHDTTYSCAIVAVVNGERLLIGGNADGGVYAMHVRTGEVVWSFKLSKRGINTSVVFADDKVYATHSEENHDTTEMGRVVCIDATGKGDVTKTHEVWRIDGLTCGYSSPALHDGKLYVSNNSANLYCIGAAKGELLWEKNIGRVMKGSPVVADGKIYVCEVNSRFLILKPGEKGCEVLVEQRFPSPDGTVKEIFGSPAVANGRVYFTTHDEIYCLGAKNWTGKSGPIPPQAPEKPLATGTDPDVLHVVPADVTVGPGDKVAFRGRLYAAGQFLGPAAPKLKATPNLGKLEGNVLSVTAGASFARGMVNAAHGGLSAAARVRVVPRPPFKVDFESFPVNKPPPGWIGAGIKFVVAEIDGTKALTKVGKRAKFMDGETFFGMSSWKNYTVVADVRGTEVRRQLPNIGLINSGYNFVLMGNTQRARVVAWAPQPRLQKRIRYKWDPDVWYRMKFRVEIDTAEDGKATALLGAKVWPRAEKEPDAWTLEVTDPTPNEGGSPAVHGYSAGVTSRSRGTQIFYDNVHVFPNR